jgi:hypothetical protein
MRIVKKFIGWLILSLLAIAILGTLGYMGGFVNLMIVLGITIAIGALLYLALYLILD